MNSMGNGIYGFINLYLTSDNVSMICLKVAITIRQALPKVEVVPKLFQIFMCIDIKVFLLLKACTKQLGGLGVL